MSASQCSVESSFVLQVNNSMKHNIPWETNSRPCGDSSILYLVNNIPVLQPVIFIVAPCIFEIHWLSHTNKCTVIYCTSL